MTWLIDFWRSSIGGKVTMAVTGLLLFAFVVVHLLGNLQLLSGNGDAINAYAKFLHSKPAMVWIARLVLLAVFALHVATGVRLAAENKAARPVGYARESTVVASFASRSMVLTGLALLAFVVYHLLHFTVGVTNPSHSSLETTVDGHRVKDVYGMVTHGFANPAIATAYAVFMVVLFFHLRHGIQSLAQTLGLNHGRYTPVIQTLSFLIAGVLAGGNILLALSVLTGIVKVAP